MPFPWITRGNSSSTYADNPVRPPPPPIQTSSSGAIASRSGSGRGGGGVSTDSSNTSLSTSLPSSRLDHVRAKVSSTR